MTYKSTTPKCVVGLYIVLCPDTTLAGKLTGNLNLTNPNILDLLPLQSITRLSSGLSYPSNNL
jgi:hypothetical protein